MAEKNDLVSQGEMQVDNYRVKGSDFPVQNVQAFTGQSGTHGTSEGKDALATAPNGNRHIEDGGPGSSGAGTPTGWNSGGRSAKVASTFPISSSGAGESGSATDNSYSINLQTGAYQYSGAGKTKVGEVVDMNVKIPSR